MAEPPAQPPPSSTAEPDEAALELTETIEVSRPAPAVPARAAGRAPEPDGALPTVDPSRYQLEAEHARGGVGRIVRARDRVLGRPIAIKERLTPGDDATARFVREALVTARLQHPSIVPVYEAGRWPSG